MILAVCIANALRASRHLSDMECWVSCHSVTTACSCEACAKDPVIDKSPCLFNIHVVQ